MTEELFDLSEFSFKALLKTEKPWEAISQIEDFIKDNRESLLKTGFQARGEVLIGKGAKIDPSAKFLGPAIIDSGSEIHDNALLRGGVIVGKNCTIGHSSEIKHSIIMNSANAAHLNYVGDSIVGNNVNLAAGVILANFKNGARNLEVSVEIGGKKTPTGLTKLGALIGDGVKIGSNTVTEPGTIIGKNSLIYPLVLLKGNIATNVIVKNKPYLEIVAKE